MPAGKEYLSPIVDWFDGLLVSWTMSTHPDAELVNTMLDLATETLEGGEQPIIHSDRGSHLLAGLDGAGRKSRAGPVNVQKSLFAG